MRRLFQLVPYEEVGRVFSLFGIGGDLAFIITNAIYSNIYRATVHWMPGFLFLFIALVQLTAGLFMLWVHFQSAKEGIGKPSAIEQRQRRMSQQLKRDSKAKLVSGCRDQPWTESGAGPGPWGPRSQGKKENFGQNSPKWAKKIIRSNQISHFLWLSR
jgi:hypothetical protein